VGGYANDHILLWALAPTTTNEPGSGVAMNGILIADTEAGLP
jgi:hypothetical protein